MYGLPHGIKLYFMDISQALKLNFSILNGQMATQGTGIPVLTYASDGKFQAFILSGKRVNGYLCFCLFKLLSLSSRQLIE